MRIRPKLPTNRLELNQISERLTTVYFPDWNWIVLILTSPWGNEVQAGTVDQFIEVFGKKQTLDYSI